MTLVREVLDHGYVRLVDSMGSDLTVVNSARVSFDKESASYEQAERGLVAWLFNEGHWSTVRHNVVTFECYAPLMLARQWWKYAVSSAHVEDQRGWNESSRRYITEVPTFYIPAANEWRTAPKDKKQGSAAPLPHLTEDEWAVNAQGRTVEPNCGNVWTSRLAAHVEDSVELYEQALEAGVAAELARLFLPAYSLYVRWRWTCSLQTLVHFFGERLAADAQHEIHDYARAVYELTSELWPNLAAELQM